MKRERGFEVKVWVRVRNPAGHTVYETATDTSMSRRAVAFLLSLVERWFWDGPRSGKSPIDL